MPEFDSFFISCISVSIGFLLILIILFKKKDKIKKNKTPYIVSWNIILSLFLISILFNLGETYYRFYVDTTDSFAINKVSQRWNKKHMQLNNLGFRDNIPNKLKRAIGKRRITIIGDSFSAGYGIKDVNKRFGNILRKKLPNIEVHVAALNGFNSQDELGTLYGMAERGYEFDIIILAYCLNDIDYLVKETQVIDKRIKSFNSQLNFIERNSYFINSLSFRYFAFKDPDFMSYSDFVLKGYQNNQIWEQHIERLRGIKKFATDLNKKIIVVTFPFLQNTFEEYTFKEAHKKLNTFWENEQVPYLDLLNIYKPHLGKNLVVNEYDAHPNEFANKLAADAIYKFFTETY